METQLKSLIEKYCLNFNLTDNQLDEIIDLALATKANPKEVGEYIQEKTEERKARIDAERKAKEEAERKARIDAERKAKEEAERKAGEAKEEAERNAEAERKAKEDIQIEIAERLVQIFNEVINEVSIDSLAVKLYVQKIRREAFNAFLHRNDSPEATERSRILEAERDKVIKAVQSGQVKTMEDLKDVVENHKE